jgi:hypothetical protein
MQVLRSCCHETSNSTGLDLVLFSSGMDAHLLDTLHHLLFLLPLPLFSSFVCTS